MRYTLARVLYAMEAFARVHNGPLELRSRVETDVLPMYQRLAHRYGERMTIAPDLARERSLDNTASWCLVRGMHTAAALTTRGQGKRTEKYECVLCDARFSLPYIQGGRLEFRSSSGFQHGSYWLSGIAATGDAFELHSDNAEGGPATAGQSYSAGAPIRLGMYSGGSFLGTGRIAIAGRQYADMKFSGELLVEMGEGRLSGITEASKPGDVVLVGRSTLRIDRVTGGPVSSMMPFHEEYAVLRLRTAVPVAVSAILGHRMPADLTGQDQEVAGPVFHLVAMHYEVVS